MRYQLRTDIAGEGYMGLGAIVSADKIIGEQGGNLLPYFKARPAYAGADHHLNVLNGSTPTDHGNNGVVNNASQRSAPAGMCSRNQPRRGICHHDWNTVGCGDPYGYIRQSRHNSVNTIGR